MNFDKSVLLIKNKKFISIILCMAMIIGLFPLAYTSVNAADKVSNPRVTDTLSEWDCIYFGSYYQSNSTTKEPIKWRVLSVDGDDALIFADQVLDGKPYNSWKYYDNMPYKDFNRDASWEDCSIRKWLNKEFLETAFTKDEQEAIKDTIDINNRKNTFGYQDEEESVDKVFLLSVDEISNPLYGFNSNKDIK